MKNRKSKGLTPREKAAAALILPGMALLCAGQLPAAIAGTALLGAGAVVLNWEEIRRAVRTARTKKSPARTGTRTRQEKITTGTLYQKSEEMSRCSK